MKYVGWINAEPEDIEALEALGVGGAMVYNELMGVLEYCEVPDKKTLKKLEKKFPGFWPGSFTLVREIRYELE